MRDSIAARLAGSIAVLSGPDDILGECPRWSADENALYWIDVRGKRLRRRDFSTGVIRDWPMPDLIGCIALRHAGGIVVGLRDRIAIFDPEASDFRTVAAPHAGLPELRFNDGYCDRQGRLWVGSMNDVTRGPVGILYRIDQRGCVPMLDGIVVPNSLCWSPDGRVMYFADGVEPIIWAFHLDTATGEISDRRPFARMIGEGIPDGATVDAEGFLWSAQYGGGVINRYAPDGRLDLTIPVAVTQPTCCAFGGPDLRTLFITTARQRLSDEVLVAEPRAGTLLAIEVEVPGLPESRFQG